MKIPCPVSTCFGENDIEAEACGRCGAALRQYGRLLVYPYQLFNQGLQEARAGNFARARDLFAAVVYWCPQDKIARNALAAACFELKDLAEAAQQWNMVLSLSATDVFAQRGLASIAPQQTVPELDQEPPPLKSKLFRKHKKKSSIQKRGR